MVPSLPLLSCELSVPVKENPDRKKKKSGFTILIISNKKLTNIMKIHKSLEVSGS